ncbi:hypothetical protein PR002_g13298 [Phytophthora rubi]|uniref:Uncharacterized protein n=1 Tax=Phytophthora rubi TaxID=129364 RepID=A0A6A3LHK0_9STRA|nr:hypothetical protein PR002_g13298 [Phytophthora rubi]
MKLEADREGLSSSPDLIIISDTSDDEEDKPAPPKEVLADAQPLPQPPIHAHTAVPPPKNRQPAPARLNYVIREVKHSRLPCAEVGLHASR